MNDSISGAQLNLGLDLTKHLLKLISLLKLMLISKDDFADASVCMRIQEEYFKRNKGAI